jgi:hypothetical protein
VWNFPHVWFYERMRLLAHQGKGQSPYVFFAAWVSFYSLIITM